jgi:hypothetical protein
MPIVVFHHLVFAHAEHTKEAGPLLDKADRLTLSVRNIQLCFITVQPIELRFHQERKHIREFL